jgi:hypothetical protein
MILRQPKVIKSLVPLLILGLSQVYVHATLTTPSTPVPQASTQAIPTIGRLEVHRGQHTRVDDTDAQSGQTILDGQTIQTSACTTASVHFLAVSVTSGPVTELGQVDLAANTKAVIRYSAGKVKVTLEHGCARIRVQQVIDGSIDTPDGKTMTATQPDTLNRRRAEVCYPRDNNQDYAPVCIPPVVWIWGGVTTAANTAAVVVAARGENPSNGTPIIR